ncbi:MAG: glycosyltransferase [Thermoflavifilum sp.]|uniref:glycosyltransferase n=1 Tax=Thermoflavifilum sp. TaxID=1968839 RepID=UPI0018A54904|nr:glycosyltransferase family 2 protein [Thermoflavifilum sp.]QOR76437.1 MAG: glycosyltransferase [Thermoflavifilum sp.]
MNNIIEILFLWVLYAYAGYVVLYLFIFSLIGSIRKSHFVNSLSDRPAFYHRIAILIPAYREDAVILSSVKSYQRLRYPADKYSVYIIADQLQPSTLAALSELPVHVIPVQFKQSSKARSINTAFRCIQDSFDIAMICDADNVLHPDFLLYINNCYLKGALAMQGQRVAKNLNTPYAILDAATEMIGNHIFRLGANALGLSSSLIGSGMAFEYNLLKNIFSEIDVLGGFDKALQLKLNERGIYIQYIPDAVVFDEKITHAHAFSNQRKRWLFTQFSFLKRHFAIAFHMLMKGNINYFHLAFLQMLILPRSLFMLYLLLLLVIGASLYTIYPIFLLFSIILFFLYFISLFMAFPMIFIRRYLLSSISSLPDIFLRMIFSLLSIHHAKYEFIHTEHNEIEINNPLYEYK